MTLDKIRALMLSQVGAEETLPFGPTTLVYKVMGKMFAYVASDEEPVFITIKCDPDEALFLRDLYPAVRPGYHMNKRHWNSVTLDGSIPEAEILQMIEDSYALVVRKLKKAERDELAQMKRGE